MMCQAFRFDSYSVAEPFLAGGARFFLTRTEAAIVAVYDGFRAFGVHSKL